MAPFSSNSMMRIAIAGSGGLARILAYYFNETSYQFIILSRTTQPELTSYGYQVIAVDYDSQSDLEFNLRGVDLVISTISGTPQINLIDAAAVSNVRRFVPSEFEGPPDRRRRHDPLDRGKAAAIERLKHWKSKRNCIMRYTVFSCGVFYERFAPNGLASADIGQSSGANYQGAYLMDIGNSTAEIVEQTTSGRSIYVSMTAVNDVGRFVAAAVALDIAQWPTDFKMYGDRRKVSEILAWAEAVKGGGLFSTDVIEAKHLQMHLDQAIYYQDFYKANRIQELIATAEKRYDFDDPNLNQLVNVTPETFWDWLQTQWGTG